MPFNVDIQGRFILDGSGRFFNDTSCCCDSTCYLLRECDADSNTCNSCDPPIPDKFYLTGSGFNDSWAIFNDTFEMTWSSSCTWTASSPPAGNIIQMEHYIGSVWQIDAGKAGCNFSILGGTGGCDPRGTGQAYDFIQNCDASSCSNTNTCTNASGYLWTVSFTDPSQTVGANEIAVDDDLSAYSYGDVIYYNEICYYLVGEIDCPASPTTMGFWVDYVDCDDCINDCGSCIPALPNTYTVFLEDYHTLGSDYTFLDDATHTLVRVAGTCFWRKTFTNPNGDGKDWFIDLNYVNYLDWTVEVGETTYTDYWVVASTVIPLPGYCDGPTCGTPFKDGTTAPEATIICPPLTYEYEVASFNNTP